MKYQKIPAMSVSEHKDDSQTPLKSDQDKPDIELKEQSKKPETDDSDPQLNEDDESIFDKAEFKALKAFSKVISPVFIISAIASLVCIILAVLEVGNEPRIFGLIIFALTLIGATMGGWGIYKFGTIEMEIDRFKQENNKYQSEIDTMKETRIQLQSSVGKLQEVINMTEGEAKTLNENLKEFDDLRNSLEDIAKDNEDILNMVNGLNKMADDMKACARASKKAALLEAYYDYDARDNNPGLSPMEFKRVLNKLDDKTRQKFGDSFKELDLDGDGVIDLKEYQIAVDKILAEDDEEAVADVKQVKLNQNN